MFKKMLLLPMQRLPQYSLLIEKVSIKYEKLKLNKRKRL
jgi:hypothetical protein